MSGFSPEWLALREPADVIARNKNVLAACHQYFAQRESIRICDIGAGTGASVRAFANQLPEHQHWTLVDHDANNLDAARDALSAWSDSYAFSEGVLNLRHGARHIAVCRQVYDFGQSAAGCWSADTDLVTASALLDLTSEAWIADFVATLAKQKTALLATLSFDGEISAQPIQPLDETVADAFRSHQTRDKGFGPAAGAASTDILKQSLERAGYNVFYGDSPWHIESSGSEFFVRTIEGIAAAVRETALVDNIEDWHRERLSNTKMLTIGHKDIFASPK